MTREIHRFRNDLLIDDNREVKCLLDKVDEWLSVFVHDPRLEHVLECPRCKFLASCLEFLQILLESHGVPFLIRHGLPEEDLLLKGWLEFEVQPNFEGSTIRLTAVCDPAGLAGFLYWYGIYPLHVIVFKAMLLGLKQAALRDEEPM